MGDYILLHEDELLGALEDTAECLDCRGGKAIHIDRTTGEVWGVAVHSVPCVRARPAHLRLVDPPKDAA